MVPQHLSTVPKTSPPQGHAHPPARQKLAARGPSTRADPSLHAVVIFLTAHGGLKTSEELVDLMRRNFNQPISLLARWISERRLLSLEWNGQLVIPMFQFDLDMMGVRPAVALAATSLNPAWDELRAATWFITPNPMLDGLTPMAALDTDPAALLHAARATRICHA